MMEMMVIMMTMIPLIRRRSWSPNPKKLKKPKKAKKSKSKETKSHLITVKSTLLNCSKS